MSKWQLLLFKTTIFYMCQLDVTTIHHAPKNAEITSPTSRWMLIYTTRMQIIDVFGINVLKYTLNRSVFKLVKSVNNDSFRCIVTMWQFVQENRCEYYSNKSHSGRNGWSLRKKMGWSFCRWTHLVHWRTMPNCPWVLVWD